VGGTFRYVSGGSLGLLELLEEHGEAIEADLQRFYGLPLAGCLHDWRRLGVLVRQLPPEAALYRSMFGEKALWGSQEHLLALIADILNAANWQRGGDKNAKRPKPLPRPGDLPDRDLFRPKGRSIAEMDEKLKRWNRGDFERTHKPRGERRVM
jgi:hypothetical protein